MEVPISFRFKVEATSLDSAESIAREELRSMRFKAYIHNYDGKSSAEMLGLEYKDGQPCNDVTLDYPERPSMGEMTIDDPSES